jgi:hypothetical protein
MLNFFPLPQEEVGPYYLFQRERAGVTSDVLEDLPEKIT